MVEITFAKSTETGAVMRFMHEHWKKDHILSKNEELFRYEFQDENRLNITLAKTRQGDICGIFGFMRYNSYPVPDLAGSLWKVTAEPEDPMLGLKMRRYTMKNVPHRFFAAPGAGLQTRQIYRTLRMNWARMDQFFILNPDLEKFTIAKVPQELVGTLHESNVPSGPFMIRKVLDAEDLHDFPYEHYLEIAPYKDWWYLKKRFFDYPIYRYDVYLLTVEDEPFNIFVCRKVECAGAAAYRLVDFYGSENNMGVIAAFLVREMREKGYEYVDFVSLYFEPGRLREAGFSRLDFDQDRLVIPNYFEPFVRQNVPVYCVSDRTDVLRYRQCKADGDQDRPNL